MARLAAADGATKCVFMPIVQLYTLEVNCCLFPRASPNVIHNQVAHVNFRLKRKFHAIDRLSICARQFCVHCASNRWIVYFFRYSLVIESWVRTWRFKFPPTQFECASTKCGENNDNLCHHVESSANTTASHRTLLNAEIIAQNIAFRLRFVHFAICKTETYLIYIWMRFEMMHSAGAAENTKKLLWQMRVIKW